MSSSLIGVTGASGKLGGSVVRQLLSSSSVAASSIVAFVRSPSSEAAQALSKLGVIVREADHSKLETLTNAFVGIKTLLLVSGLSPTRVSEHVNVIKAASASGVRRVVYTSILRADTTPLKIAHDHRATEEELKKESSLNNSLRYTILRNSWYLENYSNSIFGALKQGALVEASADGKISAAAIDDYAAAAVAVLTQDDGAIHDNKTYELGGDSAFTLSELAAEISKYSTTPVPYKNLSEEEYAALLVKIGAPASFAPIIADACIGASKGGLFDDSKTLSKLIGKPTTPLAVYVQRLLANAKN